MKIFKDRTSVGKLLAKHLKQTQADLVLGIPRGGVVVASEIAKELKLSLDVIITRKIGHPLQSELALGAIDPDGEVIWDKELLIQLTVDSGQLSNQIKQEWAELKRREEEYRLDREPLNIEGKAVILVDDGIATGSTVLTAVSYLKRHQVRTIILAVPVVSRDILEKLEQEVDEIVALHTPEEFRAVGEFYKEFNPVSDQEVVQLLS